MRVSYHFLQIILSLLPTWKSIENPKKLHIIQEMRRYLRSIDWELGFLALSSFSKCFLAFLILINVAADAAKNDVRLTGAEFHKATKTMSHHKKVVRGGGLKIVLSIKSFLTCVKISTDSAHGLISLTKDSACEKCLPPRHCWHPWPGRMIIANQF